MSVPIPSVTDLRHVSIVHQMTILINEHSAQNNPSHYIEMDNNNINRRKDNFHSQGSDKGNLLAEDTSVNGEEDFEETGSSVPGGDSAEAIHEDDVRHVFQNVNGLTKYDHVHAELQSNTIQLGGHIPGLPETKVNWRNFTFHYKWETKMVKGFTELRFNHASCNQGSAAVFQRGGISIMCTPRFHS